MMMGQVPSFSPSSTESSILPSYIMLCLTLQAHRLVSAQFTVIGSEHPITASVEGEAILSCHLSPRMSAENMEVRWYRSQFSSVVHLYRAGRDQYGDQMPEYRGRTDLLKDDITIGRVSLVIRNIQPSDDGQYSCLFWTPTFYEEALLELRVSGLGSAPAISVEGHQDRGIRVVCRSSGWYPEPEVLSRDLQGQLLPSAFEKVSQNADGLFQTELAIVITEESNRKVSCSVRNPRLNQERQSTISIAELFFPRVDPGMVALGVILSLLAVLISLASCCFWKKHRENETLRSKMETQKETLRSEMRIQRVPYEAIKEVGLLRARKYAVNMTLDPETANPRLVVSEDRKRVQYRYVYQDLPDNPERFDLRLCVLGAERFTRGRHYWEVEVGDKTQWDLGVCKESVSRKEGATPSPVNGYWAVWLRYGKYEALTSPSTFLPVIIMPSRVGIFLDYEAGEVSFYNVTDRSQLFNFTDNFSGTLRPYFYTGDTYGGNVAPLIICPVQPPSEGISVHDNDSP